MLLLLPIVAVFIMLYISKNMTKNGKSTNKLLHQNHTGFSFRVSNENNPNEKFAENIPEELKNKVLKGNVKIIGNVNKKVKRYKNGEIIEEEETNSNNIIDKKAVQKCPNCGADLDLDLDECIYCRTKIN